MRGKLSNKLDKAVLIVVIGVFFSLFLSMYFLQASGLEWSGLMKLSIEVINENILNMNFFLFLVFFSLSLAFGCLAALKLRLRMGMIAVLAGSFPAAIASFLAFSGVQGYIFVLLSLPLPFMALVWNASTKLGEMKKATRFRSFSAGIGIFTLMFAVAILLAGVAEIYPNQEERFEEWEKGMASANQAVVDQAKSSYLKATLDSQFNMLWHIHSSEQYSAMSNIDDNRATEFDRFFIGVVAGIDEARKDPEKLLDGNQVGISVEEVDTGEMLSQIPGYGIFKKYFFFVYPFLLAMLVVSLGNVAFRFIGAGFALALSAALKNI